LCDEVSDFNELGDVLWARFGYVAEIVKHKILKSPSDSKKTLRIKEYMAIIIFDSFLIHVFN
jgi:hypothetical protein